MHTTFLTIGNSGGRSKSRSASAKRSWSGGGSGGQRRSTVSHSASSSQRSSHRHQQQQQHHENQGRETSTGHGRVSHSLVNAKLSPSQVSPPPPEARLLTSTHQQREISPSTSNGEPVISSNHNHDEEEVRCFLISILGRHAVVLLFFIGILPFLQCQRNSSHIAPSFYKYRLNRFCDAICVPRFPHFWANASI